MGRGRTNDKKRVGHHHMPGEGNGQRNNPEHRAEMVRVVVNAEGKTGPRAERFDSQGADQDDQPPAPGDRGCPLPGRVEMRIGEGEQDQDRVARPQTKIDEPGQPIRNRSTADGLGRDVADGENEARAAPEQKGGEEALFEAVPVFYFYFFSLLSGWFSCLWS